jgi:hypothetical protein
VTKGVADRVLDEKWNGVSKKLKELGKKKQSRT